MINYTQMGKAVSAAAPYAVVSGGGALLGTLFGVAVNTYALDEMGEFVTVGCFNLPAAAADVADAFKNPAIAIEAMNRLKGLGHEGFIKQINK